MELMSSYQLLSLLFVVIVTLHEATHCKSSPLVSPDIAQFDSYPLLHLAVNFPVFPQGNAVGPVSLASANFVPDSGVGVGVGPRTVVDPFLTCKFYKFFFLTI